MSSRDADCAGEGVSDGEPRDGGRQEAQRENVEEHVTMATQPCVARGRVGVCWCPESFSQAKMGASKHGSNACTIIALLVAETCHSQGLKITVNPPSSKPTIDAFALCIFEGNRLHNSLWRKKLLNHVNLSVPEARTAAGDRMRYMTEWHSMLSQQNIYECLYQDLNAKTQEWYNNTPQDCVSDLNVVLIAGRRSVLFVFQQDMDTVTLFDSHQHNKQTGAVMAQVSMDRLYSLCCCYASMLHNCYKSRPTAYELSFLYFKREENDHTPPA